MSTARPNDKYEGPAWDRADAVGIHPIRRPLGGTHHTDISPTPKDLALGNALAWYLGDVQMGNIDASFLYPAMVGSPVDQWTRIARALRIHGLQISDI